MKDTARDKFPRSNMFTSIRLNAFLQNRDDFMPWNGACIDFPLLLFVRLSGAKAKK
jgi:hypothetical protein